MGKTFIGLLIVGGIGYLGFLAYEHNQNVEKISSKTEQPRPESLIRSLETSAFSPLSSSPRVPSDVAEKIEAAYRDGLISEPDMKRYRAQIQFLQKAIQTQRQYRIRYETASRANLKSFDADTKAKRTKLQLQDIERQWSEKRKILAAQYKRL